MPSCPKSGICPKQVPKVWHQQILFPPVNRNLLPRKASQVDDGVHGQAER